MTNKNEQQKRCEKKQPRPRITASCDSSVVDNAYRARFLRHFFIVGKGRGLYIAGGAGRHPLSGGRALEIAVIEAVSAAGRAAPSC